MFEMRKKSGKKHFVSVKTISPQLQEPNGSFYASPFSQYWMMQLYHFHRSDSFLQEVVKFFQEMQVL